MKTAARSGLLLTVLLAACSHTEPIGPHDQGEPIGRRGSPPPLQLTFNAGGDMDPSVFGDEIVYSRRVIPQSDSDWCLGFLSIGGGTLDRQVCPDNGIPNGRKEAMLQPVVSPDGQSIAYVRESGPAVATLLAPSQRRLMVGSVDDPLGGAELLDVSVDLFTIQGQFNPVPANAIHRLRWSDDQHLTFVAGNQRNLAGQQCCDTLYVPMALIEVDVRDGSWRRVDTGPLPPADYFIDADGSVLFTEGEDPAFNLTPMPCAISGAPLCPRNRIMRLTPDGTLDVFADLSSLPPITRMWATPSNLYLTTLTGDFIEVDRNGGFGIPAAQLPLGQLLDLVIDASGTQAVALVDSPGNPANLWLLELTP